jgi:D-alanine-D-alanine ligase
VSVTVSTAQAPIDLSKLRVALLAGGSSSEREVSLWSARGVGDALRGKLEGAPRARLPREVLDVEIDPEGRWRVAGEALAPAVALERLGRVDVFFLCLHGGQGEDGTIQGFLATAGQRFTGSGVRASAVCMDKQATRALASSAGIAIAPGACFSVREWSAEREAWLARAKETSRDGWVVKPRCGGSSVATFLVHDAAELVPAIDEVLATGDDVLVEARIAGVELSCGVLGNRGDELRALPPVEIQPAAGRFFDYQQKYSSSGANEVCPPRSVGERTILRVQAAATLAHARAGCDGYSRSDFMVPTAGGVEGEPVLLEINTLPGLTARSLLPQEAAVIGIDYTSLCLRIVELSLAAGARRGGPL